MLGTRPQKRTPGTGRSSAPGKAWAEVAGVSPSKPGTSGLGWIDSETDLDRLSVAERTYDPDPANSAVYAAAFRRFKALYPRLKPLFGS